MPKQNCPECDIEMEGRDGKKHAISHYGADLVRMIADNAEIPLDTLAKIGTKTVENINTLLGMGE